MIRANVGAIGVALIAWSWIGCQAAEPKISTERVSFESAALRGGGVTVRGDLRLPEWGGERLPAVLVLHTGAGAAKDGVSAAYIKKLNDAGIATLWIEMFFNSIPRSTRDVLPRTYGSLLWLSRHPRIDPQRIGVLGFSYGGVLAVIMSSDEVTREYAGAKARFAAHLALYPVCWLHQQILSGRNPAYRASIYRHVTGAPVRILIGDKDAYDDPASCPDFVAALPQDVRPHYAVTVYPGAYHLFDEPGAHRSHPDRFARMGRGGNVVVDYSPEAAGRSWAFAVKFFGENLAP